MKWRANFWHVAQQNHTASQTIHIIIIIVRIIMLFAVVI